MLVDVYAPAPRRRAELAPEDAARSRVVELHRTWFEIQPNEEGHVQTARRLRLDALRAQPALHLAAALVWVGRPPARGIVTFDQRLRDAARLEGLTPVPEAPRIDRT